jgi:putative redox protein
MAEIVVVRMQSNFEAEFLAADTDSPHAEDRVLRQVHAIHELTPYGMMLASLGACTGVLVVSYARNHHVALDEIEVRASYDRVFADDCEHCEEIDEYTEQIDAEIGFTGELTDKEKGKLFAISRHCPIHKILHDGIQTVFRPAQSEG